jgi:diaminopimelate decarboxylase
MVEELLCEYGSPLYVYDADALRRSIHHIASSIPYPQTRFHFACVTNGNLALMKIFLREGWGLHANTPGDAYLGLKAGFAPDQIVYTGSNLSRAEIAGMLRWGIGAFNLDSLDQVRSFCEVCSGAGAHPRLGLRLNLPEVTGGNRIGVRVEELSEAVRIASSAGLRITGIHFYRGTGTNQTSAFIDSIAPVIEASLRLPDWQYLDFGGGFGHPYHADRERFEWDKFGSELNEHLSRLPRRINLLIEPGRAVIAGCGALLARVVSVKRQGERQIAGVDTSVANIAVLAVHGGYRRIVAFKESDSLFETDVCGNTTFSRDYLGRNCALPPLEVGDAVAILDAGAYGYAMSSHFLHRPRPAEVLFEGGSHRLIRRRESYEVLIENQERG